MATIEVDLGFFIFSVVMLFFLVPLTFGLLIWKSYKNPEWWLRFRRIAYVYVLIWNMENRLLQIVLPIKKIGENGEFTLFKNRQYFWRDKYRKDMYQTVKLENVPAAPKDVKEDPLKEGLPTTFVWKKKIGALFEWDDPMPQVRVPGQSLHSMTNPRTLDAMGAAMDFKLMLRADDLLKHLKLALMVSVISIVIIIALAFTNYGVSTSLNHLSCILSAQNSNQGNATLQSLAVAACH